LAWSTQTPEGTGIGPRRTSPPAGRRGRARLEEEDNEEKKDDLDPEIKDEEEKTKVMNT
jgi:hypothetical protein